MIWMFLFQVMGLGQTQPELSRADLTAQVASLGRDLRVESGDDLKRYDQTIASGGVRRMQQLLTRLTESQLNALGGDPARVRNALRAAYSPWTPTPFEEGGGQYTAATPEVFAVTAGGRPVVLVTWLICFGGRGSPGSRFMLQAYTRKNGRFALTDETGTDLFEHHTEFMEMVPRKISNTAWMLVHGSQFGSTRNDMAIGLYLFDGDKFRVLWSRPDLPDGQVKIGPSSVTLNYREYFAPGPSFHLVEEHLAFVPAGLKTTSITRSDR